MTRTQTIRTVGAALGLLIASGCEENQSASPSEETAAEKTTPAAPKPAAGADQTEPQPAPAQDMMTSLRASCPMAADGARVEVSDTDTGVALTFTTDTGDVDDLRERAQHMAQMYETHGGHGRMMWHQMGPGGMGHMRGGGGMGQGHMMGGKGPMPAATAKAENVDKGVRIVLTPKDASQLDTLRQHVKFHGGRMGSGECWMLQNDGGADSEGQ